MTRDDFATATDELVQDVLDLLKERLAARGLKFDPERFSRETSADLEQMVRDAYFFGAETFPVTD